MADQDLVCRTCGKEFTFSQREQEFYAAKQFAEPRHCQECRALRKREKTEGADGMEIVMVRPIRQERTRSWTEVTCASCGKPAHVPFKPTGDKPIYCKDCFNQSKGIQENPVGSTANRSAPVRTTEPKPSPAPRVIESIVSEELDPALMETSTHHDWIDDPGPLPDTDPAPDEEGEITIADYIPMPISFGATAEEVNPSFDDKNKKKSGQ